MRKSAKKQCKQQLCHDERQHAYMPSARKNTATTKNAKNPIKAAITAIIKG